MPTTHNITRAVALRYGPAIYSRASSRPGVPINPFNSQNLGAIALAVANGLCASQSVTVGTTPLAVINGSLASGGVGTFDVPRNVVAAWTGTAVVTVTGTDKYGETLVESSASGTSFTGKKAFKTITAVSFSANVTGATVGSGTVIGLDYAVAANGLIKASQTNANDAATFVPADTTTATATTGDIRGTVAFASAPDGTKTYKVFYEIADVSSKEGAYGIAQFAG